MRYYTLVHVGKPEATPKWDFVMSHREACTLKSRTIIPDAWRVEELVPTVGHFQHHAKRALYAAAYDAEPYTAASSLFPGMWLVCDDECLKVLSGDGCLMAFKPETPLQARNTLIEFLTDRILGGVK